MIALAIAAGIWLAVAIFVLALCKAAAWGDAQQERWHRES